MLRTNFQRAIRLSIYSGLFSSRGFVARPNLRTPSLPKVMAAPASSRPRPFQIRQRKKQRAWKKEKKEGEPEEVLEFDVKALLKRASESASANQNEKPATVIHESSSDAFPETVVEIAELSSTGDGLGLSPRGDHVYAVPFTTTGDQVKIKVVRTMIAEQYSSADLLEVLKPGPRRDNSLIGCQYFGTCSGCQLQMLPYEDQLKHKKRIIEKAYKNFSGILPELIPIIQDTMGSPLQYGYRTKLTPHFSKPKARSKSLIEKGEGGPEQTKEDSASEVPPIGFTIKARRHVIDIEDCPLGTDVVRLGYKSERKRVADTINSFKNGATLLLRESTTRTPREEPLQDEEDPKDEPPKTKGSSKRPQNPVVAKDGEHDVVIRKDYPDYIEEKRCVTDNNAFSYEYVDDYFFQNRAGQFFQNNNSILPRFTNYIRSVAHGLPSPNSESESQPGEKKKIKYLLDAYSGSGLFTVTLSPLFVSSLGVDISPEGIEAARVNARVNKLPNTGFAAADAAHLFRDVPYPPNKTLLVIDPPRKGCGEEFLKQMCGFAPARVVYVSCNVHTQARDIGFLVQGSKGVKYSIESIKGFDLFPQTGHVESVAVLNKVVE